MEFLNLYSLSDYYAIPDYQRDYAWGSAENSTLIADVFDAMNQGGVSHFIGAIVTVPFDETNSENMALCLDNYRGLHKRNIKHVVDGQQRLTSISVLVKAISELIEADSTISDAVKDRYKRQLMYFLFGTHIDPDRQPAPRLLLNSNTGRFYNGRILGISDEAGNGHFSGAKRLLSAKKLFIKEIEEERNQTVNAGRYENAECFYDALVDTLFYNIQFVEIACDSDTNAFQVFESLNGKGLDLTAADRIKNIWMARAKELPEKTQKWESFATEVGEKYLVNFFVANFFYECAERVGKNKLPERFKNVYFEMSRIGPESLINILKRRGSIYGKLRLANASSPALHSALLDLRNLGNEQIYVMLFAAATHYQIDFSAPSQAFLDFVNEMTKLIVRMQVCERNLNVLDALFGGWIELMKSPDHPFPLESLTKKVHEEIASHLKDDEFKSHFKNYAPSDPSVSLFYLMKIEKYLRLGNGERNAGIEISGLTVEHVIPQNIESLKDWYGGEEVPPEIMDDQKTLLIERIGNKALLYGDDNSAAGDNTFLNKVGIYKNGKRGQNQGTPYGTFQLIKDVVDTYAEKFNHDEVEDRSERMAEIALKIW